jgi:hypothetical protein
MAGAVTTKDRGERRVADFIDPSSTNERLSHLEASVDGMRDQLRSIDGRLLSLENWMRTFMLTLVTVAAGVAVQIVLTVVKG